MHRSIRLLVLLIALVLVSTACGRPNARTAADLEFAREASAVEVPSTTSTTEPLRTSVSVPWAPPEVLAFADGGSESFVATAQVPLITAYAAPDDTAPVDWFESPTQFGGPRVFLVAQITPDWLQVYLPIRPNGATGWVRSSEVSLEKHPYRAEVNLSTSTVTAWRGDEVLLETAAAHGRSDRPTPIGNFYIRDIIVKPSSSGPYGSHILALSGFSEALETFGGALPAIALHGTNRPELLGETVSSGCVRLLNEDIAALAAVLPLGTPVQIVA